MKKLFALTLAAFAMVACVNEEITELPNGNEISFENAFIDNATRVGYAEADDLNEFNVWGYVESTDAVAVEIFGGTRVYKNNGVWKHDATKQYWFPERTYNFSALADADPRNVTVVENGTALESVVFVNDAAEAENYGTKDLLYATTTPFVATENQGAVAFTFNHLLSKVMFNFENAFDGVDVEIKNVTMTAPKKGTYTFADKEWTLDTTEADLTLSFGNVEKIENIAPVKSKATAQERLTIPADASKSYAINFQVVISMNGNTLYTKDMSSAVSGVEFEQGHAYKLSAAITPEVLNLTEITFDVEKVNEWSTEEIVDHYPTTGTIPNNQIWYTTKDDYGIIADRFDVFGANIVSHVFNNGKGILTFDGDVTQIGDIAFYHCWPLESITIPNSVTSIGNNAFYGCSNLKEITIPEGVTSIGYGAFAWCSGLTSFTLPESVVSVGNGICSGCPNITEFKGKYAADNGACLIVDGFLNSFAAARNLTHYTIPDGVTTIGNGVFADCNTLTSVTIPESVTSIWGAAFARCKGLTNITIPQGVTSIGWHAFADCSNLSEVYCKSKTPATNLDAADGTWDAFDNCATDLKIYVPMNSVEAYKYAEWWSDYADRIVGYQPSNEIWYTSTDGAIMKPYAFGFDANIVSNTYEDGKGVITFDADITTIGTYAFHYILNLKSISLPNGVTYIADHAFDTSIELTSLNIPEGVTYIGGNAFVGCTRLKNVTIPESVTEIQGRAFCGCSSLTSITIPENVAILGSGVFELCTSLINVYVKPTVPPTSRFYSDRFNYNASNRKIYVPMDSVDAYKSAEGWSDYADDIVGYDFE